MKVRVRVSEENIRDGMPRAPHACPIALALQDLGFKEPWVYPDGLLLRDPVGNQRESIRLSQRALTFMWRTDALMRVDPFNFDIDIPNELMPPPISLTAS